MSKRFLLVRLAVLGPLAIAFTAMVFAGLEAEERTSDREWRNALYERRARDQMREARKRTAPARPPAPADTTARHNQVGAPGTLSTPGGTETTPRTPT